MGHTKGEPCSCGFPQSYPIPHEHDRTARENQIIAHYEDSNKAMYEALEAVDDYLSAPYPENMKLKQIAAGKLVSALALAREND